ncbi:hypothetical protein COCHEDRAFT_1210187 [Bipolaris maydis C5]|uniref:Uncharacterized protein n=2 Tax=Cochliobolus heterostrophus TaxID=5016 RepID=M2V868_COCH5|nr:hypothetical protein COCHEDRAFT_1210187 [Bipolaris maydis C5]KAJ5030634.1 hypothetical protein J3E73DRAFT_365975 [Bipolaris maydis]KAJ6213290.1 hypothetical protein PSV09DRAFT_1210187 [Bipolaris maydis]KAJ6274527.1 hypothetical protein PSV08DRAFT_347268 [Bipolaris maydis]
MDSIHDLSLPESDIDIDLSHDLDTGGSVTLRTSLTPFEEDLFDIPDAQNAYTLRKRTEKRGAYTFLDQDTSGNFDPSNEKRVPKKTRTHAVKFPKKVPVKLQSSKASRTDKTSKTHNFYNIPKPTATHKTIKGKKKVRSKTPPSKDQEQDKAEKPPRILEPRYNNYLTPEALRIQPVKSRSLSPDILEDTAGNWGQVIRMKTSFTHPIQFDVSLGDDNILDCSFCNMAEFSFVGYFEQDVYCIRWENGCGYTHIAGGQTKHGQTRRAQIVMCEGHDIQRIYPDTVAVDFAEILNDLLTEEDPAAIKRQLLRWCSMCFSPAVFACRKRQSSLFSKNEEIDSCGLRLCAACEIRLRENFEGDTSAMAATLDDEDKAKEDDEDLHGKVRADVGFLSTDGILARNLNCLTEVEDE